MTASFLVEKTVDYLDRMSKYYVLNESTEGTDNLRADWLPPVLHDFLWHLSSPVDPEGLENLYEAKSIVINRAETNQGAQLLPTKPRSLHKAMDMPKSSAMIKIGREEAPNENLHKRMHAGFRKAFREIAASSDEKNKADAKESRRVYTEFARKRGYQEAPDLLRGNLKTEKSTGEGVLTTGLNLAPHGTSGLDGFDVCPQASTECRASCLGTETGGNKMFPDNALASKIMTTHFLAFHPEHAARILHQEINAHKIKAAKLGYQAGVRPNMTSDFSFGTMSPELFTLHQGTNRPHEDTGNKAEGIRAEFYDYSKVPSRVEKSLESSPDAPVNKWGHPNNYFLALSHTGTGHRESNDKHVISILEKGGVAAMVFQKKKGGARIVGSHLPTHVEDVSTGKRYAVTNGDTDDNIQDRHTSLGLTHGTPGKGVVSGLRLKGKKNVDALEFANPVGPDGICRINRPSI